MMRTEDAAQVSLEDTFTSEADSPENSGKGSTRVGSPSKRKTTHSNKGGIGRSCCRVLYHTFGPLSPFCGNETWEEVGTSWLLPDAAYILWRIIAFGTMLGLHMGLLRSDRHSIADFSTDVYTMALVTTALLLLPAAALLLNGPHEDDLDSDSVRWVWSVIGALVQISTTTCVYMTSVYFALTGKLGRRIHVVPTVLLQVELSIGCTVPRLSYAIVGSMLVAMQFALAVTGMSSGIGAWLVMVISQSEWECMLAVGVHVLTSLCVVAIGRGRCRAVAWLEGRRNGRGVSW